MPSLNVAGPAGPSPWRLILDGAADGATNMAVDDAIRLAVGAGDSPPTIRFYAWQPACVSLGRFQAVGRAIDRAACRRLGVDVVRRPTGGRAVVHNCEVTYSVIAPLDTPTLAGGILPSYRAIADGIARGLRTLGADVEVVAAHRQAALSSPACFDLATDYEIVWHGRKLVGSAQCRGDGALLQHGAILLDADLSLWAAVLAGRSPLDLASQLGGRVATLRQALGRLPDFDEVAGAVRQGIEESLAVSTAIGRLADAERWRMEQLRRERYAAEEWNQHR